MSFVTNDAMNVTGDLVAPFVILSFVYLVLIQFINMLSKYLEKKLNPALKTLVSA